LHLTSDSPLGRKHPQAVEKWWIAPKLWSAEWPTIARFEGWGVSVAICMVNIIKRCPMKDFCWEAAEGLPFPPVSLPFRLCIYIC
jgi:hypothetical protein